MIYRQTYVLHVKITLTMIICDMLVFVLNLLIISVGGNASGK